MQTGFSTALLMRISDPLLTVTADGMICFANDSFQALAGWTKSLVGLPVRTIIKNWDNDYGPEGDRAELATANIERLDGLLLAVELQISSWRTPDGTYVGLIVRRLPEVSKSNDDLKQQQDRANPVLEEARIAHKLLEDVVEMLPQAVCVFDAQDRYLLWNKRYSELYPEIADHLRVGIPFSEILRLSYNSGQMAEKADDFEIWLADRLAKYARPAWREEQELKDGRWLLHDDRRLSDGGSIGMRIDITDLKRRESSFRLLFQSNPVPMLIFEAGTLRISDANDAACSLYGYDRAVFPSLRIQDLHEEREREAASQIYGGLVDTYEERTIWHHRTVTGDIVDVLIFIRASMHQDRPCFLAAVVDVSDRIRAEAKIAHIAHHDSVTGLANRIRFREVAETALAVGSNGRAGRVAIHFIDLDGFKLVNDTYGHSAGDKLLYMVGERLRAAVRSGDLVARLGGDEFAVVQISGLGHAKAVAARLLASLEESFLIDGEEVHVGASLGLAVAPRDGIDLDALVDAADLALYQAKAAGRNVWRSAGDAGQTRSKAMHDNGTHVSLRGMQSKSHAK